MVFLSFSTPIYTKKKTNYLETLLKKDPLLETYKAKGLLDWDNLKTYEDDINKLIENTNIIFGRNSRGAAAPRGGIILLNIVTTYPFFQNVLKNGLCIFSQISTIIQINIIAYGLQVTNRVF